MDRQPVRAMGRRGLHAQVVDEVGRRIVTGHIAPESILDLGALEVEFGVSHTAMREAIKVLTAKQLVDARPKLGTYVLPRAVWNLLDPDVMAWRDQEQRLQVELAEVRFVMEPAAAALAAERATDAQRQVMQTALERMEDGVRRAEAGAPVDWADVAEADVEFHATLAAATGNELLEEFQRLLWPAMRSRDLAILPLHHRGEFLVEHRAVLDGILARSPGAASTAMTELLTQAKFDYLSRHPG